MLFKQFLPVKNLNYLIRHPTLPLVYGTLQHDPLGAVSVFKIDSDQIIHLSELPLPANCPCHGSVLNDFLYLACYGENGNSAVVVVKLNGEGVPTEVAQVLHQSGELGPEKDRQDASHPHCAVVSSYGLIVCDLGLDSVFCYPIQPDGQLGPPRVSRMRAGSGPRHAVLRGDVIWVLGELNNTVSRGKIQAGEITWMETVGTLPKFYSGYSKAAAIRLSWDGQRLICSNRGHDSLALFSAAGPLTEPKIIPLHGREPRDFNFVGESLVVACLATNNLEVWEECDEGGLRSVPASIPMTAPLTIVDISRPEVCASFRRPGLTVQIHNGVGLILEGELSELARKVIEEGVPETLAVACDGIWPLWPAQAAARLIGRIGALVAGLHNRL